ncbi:MAG: HAD family hydrolase [Planctomycetota bacterium]|jgi:HAD superfamily hydrolase (TIGR01549 family)
MTFEAIVFDLGNTLVPWTARETVTLYAALEEVFQQHCGAMPDFFDRATAARDRLIAHHQDTDMREVTIDEFAEAVCDGAVPDGLCEDIATASAKAFRSLAHIPDYVPDLLGSLAQRYRLAVLSNFYLSEPIHDLLGRSGIARHLTHVEVSATTGFAKPHPEPFDVVRCALDTPMERILMVGDEFWADVVGANRAGFLTALTHEHRQGPTSDPRAPDVRADRIITSLRELL